MAKRESSIKQAVKTLYEHGASIDAIEGRIVEQFCGGNVEKYVADGSRSVVVGEIEALRTGRRPMDPSADG